MMSRLKKVLLTIVPVLAVCVFFISCEEQMPPGLDLGDGALVEDSSYNAALETPQQKNVVVEEVTGVQCTNCPSGARLLKSINQQNNDRTFVIAIHATGFAEPYSASQYDFRTEDGTDIVNSLGQPGLPAAAVDRVPNTQGSFFQSKSAWSNLVAAQVAKNTPVNIHIESNYNSDGNECQLMIRSAFTEDVSDELNLYVYVIEDDIIDYQLDGEAADPNVLDYKHDHVFRKSVTNTVGTPLNFGEKTAGNVLQKRIVFNPLIDGDNAWNLDNCHIIAFIATTGDSREIIHAEEVKLKP